MSLDNLFLIVHFKDSYFANVVTMPEIQERIFTNDLSLYNKFLKNAKQFINKTDLYIYRNQCYETFEYIEYGDSNFTKYKDITYDEFKLKCL